MEVTLAGGGGRIPQVFHIKVVFNVINLQKLYIAALF